MRMILLFENGLRSEAVLLAASDHKMRVVVRGTADTTELRRIKDQWISEEGDAVDIESIFQTEQAFDAVTHDHAA